MNIRPMDPHISNFQKFLRNQIFNYLFEHTQAKVQI